MNGVVCRTCGGTAGCGMVGDPRPVREVVCASCGSPMVPAGDLVAEIGTFEGGVAARRASVRDDVERRVEAGAGVAVAFQERRTAS